MCLLDQVPNSLIAQVHVRSPPTRRLLLPLHRPHLTFTIVITGASTIIVAVRTTIPTRLNLPFPLGEALEDVVDRDAVRDEVVLEPALL